MSQKDDLLRTNTGLSKSNESLLAEVRKLRSQLRMAQIDAVYAEHYRWLRQQFWVDSNIFVIAGSKSQVKLGTDCPNLERLDEMIAQARGLK